MGQVTAGDLLISGLSYLRTWSEEGVGIGAASNSTMGNIVLKDIKTLEVGTRLGAGIGATSGGVVGNISISADGIWGVLTTAGDANGTNIGEHGGTCGTIDINANYIYLGACYSDPSRGTYATHQNCTGTTILPTATINGMAFNPNGQSYAKDPSLKNNQVYEYIGPDSSLSDEAEKTLLLRCLFLTQLSTTHWMKTPAWEPIKRGSTSPYRISPQAMKTRRPASPPSATQIWRGK